MAQPTVLIVDDDDDIVEILTALLERDGYRCRGAPNGERALEISERERPALVLLDMQMPVMNGQMCARALRERYGPELPIIIMTAAAHPRVRYEHVDANDLLEKPFGIDRLLRTIRQYVAPPARGAHAHT